MYAKMDDIIKKKLPIGIEDFAEIRTEGFYYLDKTALIADLLYNWGKVNLFTRPRRFGKTLNMSMLKTFLVLAAINCCLKVWTFQKRRICAKNIWVGFR